MDQHVVARARRGDTDAFEALVVDHHDRLFRVAHGILRDPHLAEDATQQAFLDMWREISRLRDPAKFEAWSYRLLVRVCYREAKRKPEWAPESDLSFRNVFEFNESFLLGGSLQYPLRSVCRGWRGRACRVAWAMAKRSAAARGRREPERPASLSCRYRSSFGD